MHVLKTEDHPSFRLEDGRIEVWCVDTSVPPDFISQLERVLSMEEKDRAARFQFARHRNAYVVSRGLLRSLLARYTGSSELAVTFQYGGNGKPFLPHSRIQFNISHTDGLVILAFAEDCALGVDVEYIRPIDDMTQIASRFFSPAEARELAGLPEGKRQRAFFLCWTRKEAYIKALGDGLSIPLSDFQVTFADDEPARFVQIGTETSVHSEWVLQNLEISRSHAAAIAYPGAPKAIFQSPLLSPELAIDKSR